MALRSKQSRAAGSARRPVILGLALMLIALNLRVAVAGVPPVLDNLRADFGLSTAAAGLLTTVPLLIFGLAAPLAPRLVRRSGPELVLLGCLVLMAVGAVLRVLPSVAVLFAGSAILAIGVAIANVVIPSVIKRDFVRPGVMMGIYTTALSVSASAGLGLTVALERGMHSWRWALGLAAVPAVVAAVLWLPSVASRRPLPLDARAPSGLWRNRTARLVTGAFAMQSVLFYAALAWLPDVLRADGMSPSAAGVAVSVSVLVALPVSLVVPIAADRLAGQQPLAVGMVLLWVGGLSCLLLSPQGTLPIWIVLIGFGQGAGVSLTFSLIVLRSRDDSAATALSGMAQSVGYPIAAAGVLVLGVVHDVAGSWTMPLTLMIAGCAALAVFSIGASDPAAREVSSDA